MHGISRNMTVDGSLEGRLYSYKQLEEFLKCGLLYSAIFVLFEIVGGIRSMWSCN